MDRKLITESIKYLIKTFFNIYKNTYPEPWWTTTAARSYSLLPLPLPRVSCWKQKDTVLVISTTNNLSFKIWFSIFLLNIYSLWDCVRYCLQMTIVLTKLSRIYLCMFSPSKGNSTNVSSFTLKKDCHRKRFICKQRTCKRYLLKSDNTYFLQ